MTNAIAIDKNGALATEPFIDREKQSLLADTILKGASANELALFVNLCTAKRLDPFTRQIYGIKTGQGLQMFASIDGLRVIAQRSGQYAGQVGPFWCGTDGQWTDVWLAQEPPAAAKVGVLRKGWDEPMWGVATLKSYGKDSPIWKKMADIMLAKCAESVALRKAFPDDISGLYIREEFGEAETPEPSTRPAEATTARPTATVVPAEVVDAETVSLPVDVKQRADELAALIKQKREGLGWKVNELKAVAQEQGCNLNRLEGLEAMWRYLIDLSAVMDTIQDARKQLGWNAFQWQEAAEVGGYDVKNLDHMRQFAQELTALKRQALDGPDDDDEAAEAYEAQGTLIDAETAPIDRWA